jgi:hypothetical protein
MKTVAAALGGCVQVKCRIILAILELCVCNGIRRVHPLLEEITAVA